MRDWDAMPRLLQELCNGHPGIVAEVYGYDLQSGLRLWICKTCYTRREAIDQGRYIGRPR